MKCEICGKETDIANDGGLALLMATCIRHGTTFNNLTYCEDCYQNLARPHLVALCRATGMNIPELEDEE